MVNERADSEVARVMICRVSFYYLSERETAAEPKPVRSKVDCTVTQFSFLALWIATKKKTIRFRFQLLLRLHCLFILKGDPLITMVMSIINDHPKRFLKRWAPYLWQLLLNLFWLLFAFLSIHFLLSSLSQRRCTFYNNE